MVNPIFFFVLAMDGGMFLSTFKQTTSLKIEITNKKLFLLDVLFFSTSTLRFTCLWKFTWKKKKKTFSIIMKAHVLTHCEDCFIQCHSCGPPDVVTVTLCTVFLQYGHHCVICSSYWLYGNENCPMTWKTSFILTRVWKQGSEGIIEN